jgi:hypothetical protein
VVPVDTDGNMEEADMELPTIQSLKIMMKHHGKFK